MDKGTHFFKCDFQVHSPRDINWEGDRPLTPEQRQLYAEEFIKKSREVGLTALAITDHHDFGFFSIIKDATNSERDNNGQIYPITQRIIVFPGLEMTLS